MLKKVLVMFLFCSLLLGGLSVDGSAADKTITLTTLNWKPYIGEDLKNNGYVAEIAKKALNRSGYKLKMKFLPWARTLKLAEQGKVDGYFPEYYAEERAEKFIFSEKFPGGPLGFFKRKEADITYNNLSDLKPYTIGVVRGYVNTKEFDNADYLNKQPARNDLVNFKKLLAGRLDLMVADKYVGQYLLQKNLPNKADEVEFVKPVLEYKPLYICFTNDNQEYARAFNQGLKEMKEDGTIDKILEKHGF